MKNNKTEKLEKLSIGQLAALCSNLARSCQKQYKFEEEKLFLKLAKYFSDITPEINDESIEELTKRINDDIDNSFIASKRIVEENNDRGSLRSLVWSEKVTRMINSLLRQYNEKGDEIFADEEVWICTVCGFIYIGSTVPNKCPICKAPNIKFEKIEVKL